MSIIEEHRAQLFELSHCISDSGWSEKVPELKKELNEDKPILFYFDPILWIQEAPTGFDEAAEKFKNKIDANSLIIPSHIKAILFGNKTPIRDMHEKDDIVTKLCSLGGEDNEILFCKPANEAQLNIARDITNRDAVVVQGPPGTGKTHTIANLIGNFLAQGKRVLVTSETKKALSVLKDKLPESIQGLCVTDLGDNKDLNKTVSNLVSKNNTINQYKISKEIENTKNNRLNSLKSLKDSRKKIFDYLKGDMTNKIVYKNKKYTYEQLGKWLNDNKNIAEDIPADAIIYNEECPITQKEIDTLYQSNIQISNVEEQLLQNNKFSNKLYTPDDVHKIQEKLKNLKTEIDSSSIKVEDQMEYGDVVGKKYFCQDDGNYLILDNSIQDTLFNDLSKEKLLGFDNILIPEHKWEIKCIRDGIKGKDYKENWEKLIQLIRKKCRRSA